MDAGTVFFKITIFEFIPLCGSRYVQYVSHCTWRLHDQVATSAPFLNSSTLLFSFWKESDRIWRTRSFAAWMKKKSRGLRSGSVDLTRIQSWSWLFVFKTFFTLIRAALALWAVVPSCWSHNLCPTTNGIITMVSSNKKSNSEQYWSLLIVWVTPLSDINQKDQNSPFFLFKATKHVTLGPFRHFFEQNLAKKLWTILQFGAMQWTSAMTDALNISTTSKWHKIENRNFRKTVPACIFIQYWLLFKVIHKSPFLAVHLPQVSAFYCVYVILSAFSKLWTFFLHPVYI